MKPDLQTEQNRAKKMLENRATLASIYKELRNKKRLQLIGDYLIVRFICRLAKELGIEVSRKSIVGVLKITQDGEFKRIRQNSELVSQIYA